MIPSYHSAESADSVSGCYLDFNFMLILLAYCGSGAVGSGAHRIGMIIEPLKEKYTYLNCLP